MKEAKQLKALLEELQVRIPNWQHTNKNVSASGVGWHIAHTTLATTRIIGALKQSQPGEYKWKPNWKRSLIFFTRKIPRGKIKAPAVVMPQGDISVESLNKHIEKVKAALQEIGSLQPKNHLNHPYLGKLDLKSTLRFLNIHAKHHLKIIDEIVAGQV